MSLPSTSWAAPDASSGQEISVERLLGRRVRDPDGNTLGRVEEIIAEIRGTEWTVIEVHLGVGALVGRLVEISSLVPIIGKLAWSERKRYRLLWNELDLSDPDHPRSLVRHVDLERYRISESG